MTKIIYNLNLMHSYIILIVNIFGKKGANNYLFLFFVTELLYYTKIIFFK